MAANKKQKTPTPDAGPTASPGDAAATSEPAADPAETGGGDPEQTVEFEEVDTTDSEGVRRTTRTTRRSTTVTEETVEEEISPLPYQGPASSHPAPVG